MEIVRQMRKAKKWTEDEWKFKNPGGGELIRQKCIKKGWSQEKLSSEAGISIRFLQAIEAGDRTPSLGTILKLSQAFGITPDKFVMPVWKEWLESNKWIYIENLHPGWNS